jgi:ABC-type oligopeptide transport system ATPase subunit
MNKQTSANELFAQMHENISLLLKEIPVLTNNINFKSSESAVDIAGFIQLKKLPGRYVEIEGKPVIICSLVGPSGAGKSTVFNLLTNLSTPAGGAVRPMTFSSLVAIPEEIYGKIDCEMLFPGFNLVELQSKSDLRNKNLPASQLFKTSYKQPESDFWLCLVDIPDFNTTEKTNWTKAQQMIDRADSIIYAVYVEAYKDSKSYDFLKKCCRLSGSLSYLLTKVDSDKANESAKAVRNDLIDFSTKDPEFNEQRSDKTTLLKYFKDTPFYYSERSKDPDISDFHPLANTNLSFNKFLFGQRGLEIILKHYLQSISVAVKSCRSICIEAQSRREMLEEKLGKVDKEINETAERIVGEEFPVFHVLAMIKKLLEENRPGFLKRIMTPVRLIGTTLKNSLNTLHQKVKRVGKSEFSEEVAERDKLERERLKEFSEKLVEKWRESHEKEELNSENCRKQLLALETIPLPPVDEEWEIFVRNKIENWFENNKNRWIWLNVINDLLIAAGTGFFIADVFIDGGIGTLGVVAAVGGSSAASGFFLSLFNHLGLAREINQAHKLWKDLRGCSYVIFLKNKLAKPLLTNPWLLESEKLDKARIEKCQSACENLEEISKTHEFGTN